MPNYKWPFGINRQFINHKSNWIVRTACITSAKKKLGMDTGFLERRGKRLVLSSKTTFFLFFIG